MSASPLNFLRAGPPPPKVVLLPDALFFSRTIPIPAGTPPVEVAAQVELALESISPFPVAQLYHGYFHAPGSAHALVFAAYRRRFTAEQTAAWAGADLVLPTFAALLGGELPPATTLILTTGESLTAIHARSGGSVEIFTEPLAPDAIDPSPAALAQADDDRARARDTLIRAAGGSTHIIDLAAPPAADPAGSDGEIAFRSGTFASRLPTATAAALDVRDKEDLAALRRARARDVLFWRVAVGCVAALALLALGEFALIGGRGLWQKSRLAQLNAQKPTVEKIMAAQKRAVSIEDLSTKRLLPLEMVSLVAAKIPSTVLFQRAVADVADRDHIVIEAKAENSGEITLFKTALESLPECARVEIGPQQTASGSRSTTFSVSITFKPGTVKPAPSS